MNRGLCNKCRSLVAARHEPRDGKLYLIKDCPDCGPTETLISSDLDRYQKKHAMDGSHQYEGCALTCLHCHHKRPNLVFVDVTNRCNMNCPICINNTPSMGFLFEPPIEYFDKIFDYFAQFDPKPPFQLFGGEPTVRKDFWQIVDSARSRGLPVRVVTNGLKLADPTFCEELVRKHVTVLIAYDNSNPELYRVLRNHPESLQKKLQAIDNLCKLPKAKVVLMSLVAKGFNEKDLPELFAFCHARRNAIRGVYFMPLAHTWKEGVLDLEPERITPEDVEGLVAAAFPDDPLYFMPAGFLGQIPTLLRFLPVKPLPFAGAHPNCESLFLLVSDGERYVPLSRYLRRGIVEIAQDLIAAEQRFKRRVERSETSRIGRAMGALRLRRPWLTLRAFLAVAPVLRKSLKIRALLQGNGIGKLWHGLMVPLKLAFGARSEDVFARHTRAQRVLQLIVLPFEDKSTLETERLERCPTAFTFYDPKADEVKWVPVCAWGLHKTETMRAVSEYYGEMKAAQAGNEAQVAQGTLGN